MKFDLDVSLRTDAEEREKCCRRKLARSSTSAPLNDVKASGLENLVRCLVVTRGAARLTVHQAVSADANIDDRLAETAVLLALTLRFRLFTLRAAILRGTCRSAHAVNASATGRSDET